MKHQYVNNNLGPRGQEKDSVHFEHLQLRLHSDFEARNLLAG